MTPVTAIKIIDESPHCWVIIAYNSNEDDNLSRIKDLTNGINELFYERCGVAVLDLAYPSNHFTFGPVIEDTPMILFRKPNALHQMFHVEHVHSDINHFQLDKLYKWGIVFNTQDLENHVDKVIEHLVGLYNQWVDPNYKLLAVAMEHYDDDRKMFLKLSYDHLIKIFHHDAVIKGSSLFSWLRQHNAIDHNK